jgi:hypothetical protein
MNKFLNVFVRAALVWVVFALTFQVTMLAIVVVNPELVKKISHELSWKLDGTFNK